MQFTKDTPQHKDLKDFFKRLFIHERHKDIGRGRSRLHAGSQMWDLILGLQDHALGSRQMLSCQATQASQDFFFKILFIYS